MLEEKLEFERFMRSNEFFDYPNSEESSQKTILRTLTSEETKKSSSPDYEVKFSKGSKKYCVGFVDIVNSTKISASLPSEKLSKYYEIFLNSLSKIIGKFDGKVIKNIGDCLLYYFPNQSHSSIEEFANCLNCGLAMVKAQEVISEKMVSKKLPKLNYRISAEFGIVIPMKTNVSLTVDLIGHPVNMCAKINHCADHNEFVIGSELFQKVKKLTTYKFEEIKSYDVGFHYPYTVHRVASLNS